MISYVFDLVLTYYILRPGSDAAFRSFLVNVYDTGTSTCRNALSVPSLCATSTTSSSAANYAPFLQLPGRCQFSSDVNAPTCAATASYRRFCPCLISEFFFPSSCRRIIELKPFCSSLPLPLFSFQVK